MPDDMTPFVIFISWLIIALILGFIFSLFMEDEGKDITADDIVGGNKKEGEHHG